MLTTAWNEVDFGQVATLQRGYDLPSRARKRGTVPVVTSTGITDTHAEARERAPGVVTGRYGTNGEVFFIEEDYWPHNTTLFVKDFHSNDPLFVSYLLRTIDFQSHSGKSGVPGVNRNDLHALRVSIPPTVAEQRAIAGALSDVDELIGRLDQLIAKKRNLKQATMQQLLTGQTRLPGFGGKWEVKKIGELLKYERPDKYFVKSDDYQDSAKTPVLTANKSFVLGHTNEDFGIYDDLPAIIFDDFTTDSKFVEFRFKIKSSAIKILKARSAEANLKFVYERMRLINFPLGEYKRHYISEFQIIEIPTPKPAEQTAIAVVLSDMDAELAALEQQRDKTRALKQGMMQELLTGRIRLPLPDAMKDAKTL